MGDEFVIVALRLNSQQIPERCHIMVFGFSELLEFRGQTIDLLLDLLLELVNMLLVMVMVLLMTFC